MPKVCAKSTGVLEPGAVPLKVAFNSGVTTYAPRLREMRSVRYAGPDPFDQHTVITRHRWLDGVQDLATRPVARPTTAAGTILSMDFAGTMTFPLIDEPSKD